MLMILLACRLRAAYRRHSETHLSNPSDATGACRFIVPTFRRDAASGLLVVLQWHGYRPAAGGLTLARSGGAQSIV